MGAKPSPVPQPAKRMSATETTVKPAKLKIYCDGRCDSKYQLIAGSDEFITEAVAGTDQTKQFRTKPVTK